MEIKDLIITPIYLGIFTVMALIIRPYVTNKRTQKYFLPALWVRFIGAIGLGIIYTYYYRGGDTFNYWAHGSSIIWEAFFDDPIVGLNLLASSGGAHIETTMNYSTKIWFYSEPSSYFVIRLAALFDLFSYNTYTTTALFFAVFAFSGSWAFFSSITKLYWVNKWIVLTLFIPSIAFWGSGILKDTVTLGALGWLTFALISIIEFRRKIFISALIGIITIWMIYSIKTYIILCYLPFVSFWIFWKNQRRISNAVARVLALPAMASFFLFLGYFLISGIGSNTKYGIENVAKQAAITSYDIRYGWGATAGGEGGYDLGRLDGSVGSMLRLMPAAINVSLFRPYLWEVKNPLMLLTALESLLILILTFNFLRKRRFRYLKKEPFLMFCLFYSIVFAFAVGISTYNFGTLMRYKIPMMPFYLTALGTFLNNQKRN